MGFVNDTEDIYSMCLTVLKSLLEKYEIDPQSIGRLEVGTETLLDKSKSVKSVLMQLLGDNTDVEGVDTVNACYGGTNALFNAINWVESSAWDGRDAIVVTGDIAIYDKGSARPTGGAGTVAMLIGPDAPIVFDSVRGTHIEHVYDFYKPDFTSEYPYVDGHYSLTCYTKALDKAYGHYNKKAEKFGLETTEKGLKRFDYNVFHAPTCKLVSKSYARLLFNDFRDDPASFADSGIPSEYATMDYEKTLTDKGVEKAALAAAKELAAERLAPSIKVPTNCGNMYCASVYSGLASCLYYVGNEKLQGKRIGFFSYGSGLAASFFSAVVKGDISKIVEVLDVEKKLQSRSTKTPQEYEAALELREKLHLKKGVKPSGSIEDLKPGTYYLTEVNDMFQRFYAVKE